MLAKITRLITDYKLFLPPTILHIVILMLISLYFLENYAIICIEMVTYPFYPTECQFFIECSFLISWQSPNPF